LKILLDENFPLALYRSLKANGEDVEHIITLGLRGTPDHQIRERLLDKNVLFLTQDEDFLFDRPTEAIVVLSRVRQVRPLVERIDVWRRAGQPEAGRRSSRDLRTGRPRTSSQRYPIRSSRSHRGQTDQRRSTSCQAWQDPSGDDR
jgi:hypothetical protein